MFDNYVDAYEKEAELVSPEFLQENKGKVYNLKPGGEGGFGMTEHHKQVLKDLFTGVPKTPEHRAKMGRSGEENSMFGLTGDKHPRFGTTHTDESKQKMSEKATIRMSDPEYTAALADKIRGRNVIHKGVEEKMVQPGDLESYFAEGWTLGRPPEIIEDLGTKRIQNNLKRRCKDFGVETTEELKSKFEELYYEQNMTLAEISEAFPITIMGIQTMMHNLDIQKKTRSQRYSSRSKVKNKVDDAPSESKLDRMERERCEKFGVETNDELRELIVELYINQNMRIDDILLMYPKVSGMMFKTIRKKLNIPSKTREMWQSTAKR